METVDVITLEDGLSYVIIDKINHDGITYVYLSNEENIENICVRKINIINGNECLVGLNSPEEFQEALNYFTEKHHQ